MGGSELNRHHRRSIRLPGYDYSQPGVYFLTLCTHERETLLGDVVDNVVRLNDYGQIVAKAWDDLPGHYSHVELDAFVIMPNHVHGIIVLNDDVVRAGLRPAPTRPAPTPTKRHALPEIVRTLKSFSARRINESHATPGVPVWQRNYYEHVVRSEHELNAIRAYIQNNPLRWALDHDNPINAPRLSISDTVDQYLRDAGL